MTNHGAELNAALEGAAGGREGSGTIRQYTNEFAICSKAPRALNFVHSHLKPQSSEDVLLTRYDQRGRSGGGAAAG